MWTPWNQGCSIPKTGNNLCAYYNNEGRFRGSYRTDTCNCPGVECTSSNPYGCYQCIASKKEDETQYPPEYALGPIRKSCSYQTGNNLLCVDNADPAKLYSCNQDACSEDSTSYPVLDSGYRPKDKKGNNYLNMCAEFACYTKI